MSRKTDLNKFLTDKNIHIETKETRTRFTHNPSLKTYKEMSQKTYDSNPYKDTIERKTTLNLQYPDSKNINKLPLEKSKTIHPNTVNFKVMSSSNNPNVEIIPERHTSNFAILHKTKTINAKRNGNRIFNPIVLLPSSKKTEESIDENNKLVPTKSISTQEENQQYLTNVKLASDLEIDLEGNHNEKMVKCDIFDSPEKGVSNNNYLITPPESGSRNNPEDQDRLNEFEIINLNYPSKTINIPRKSRIDLPKVWKLCYETQDTFSNKDIPESANDNQKCSNCAII